MLWWTLQQLKSKEASTRIKAVEKLAGDDDPKAIEALIGLLGDPDEEVRKSATKAIGESRDANYLRPLVQSLRDRNEHVRANAADALRQLGDADAASALVFLLSDVSATVRWQAARALEGFNWSPPDNAAAARFNVARGRIAEAVAYGSDAVDALTIALQGGEYYQRRQAVTALCEISDARVVKALLIALKDSDDQVRSAAVESLLKIAEPASVPALTLALSDANKHVRAVAAEALGQFGGPKSVDPLLRRIADKQWEVREAVCIALGKLKDPRAFEPLVNALRDLDREVREAAVRGLGYLGDKRAVGPILGAVVDEHDSVRQVATATLTTIDMHWERSEAARVSMPMLQEALKHPQYWVRQSAADALARIGSMKTAEPAAAEPAVSPTLIEPAHLRKQATLDVLIGLLSDFDRELRFAAAETLGRIGQTSAVAPLSRSLKDADKAVRKAAAQAVEILRGKPTPETNLILRGEDFPL